MKAPIINDCEINNHVLLLIKIEKINSKGKFILGYYWKNYKSLERNIFIQKVGGENFKPVVMLTAVN